MNDRPYTYELAALLILFIGIATFGAVNWNSHLAPNPPGAWPDTPPLVIENRIAHHATQMENVGKDAVIPFVYSVPLTFMGLVGAVACLGWIIWKNSPDAIR